MAGDVHPGRALAAWVEIVASRERVVEGTGFRYKESKSWNHLCREALNRPSFSCLKKQHFGKTRRAHSQTNLPFLAGALVEGSASGTLGLWFL